MLDLNNIRFTSYLHKPTEQFIATYSSNSSYKSTYEGECKTVFRTIMGLNLKSNERQKIGTQSGNWYCMNDPFDFTYMVLVSPQYSETLAYKLIDEVIAILHSIPSFKSESTDSLRSKTNKNLQALCKKYEDPSNVSKIHEAQKNVKDTTKIMEKNMQDVIDRQGKLDNLDIKAKNLEMNANEFKDNSKTIKKIMCCKNAKLTAIALISTLVVIAIIVVVIVVAVKK